MSEQIFHTSREDLRVRGEDLTVRVAVDPADPWMFDTGWRISLDVEIRQHDGAPWTTKSIELSAQAADELSRVLAKAAVVARKRAKETKP